MALEKEPSSSSQNSSEPRGLLRTLFSAFSGVLFGLFLSKLKTPIQQSVEAIHPQATTDDSRAKTKAPLPVAVTIESYPPPPVTEEDKAEKQRQRRFQWGHFAASGATALITLGILCVTFRYTKYAGGQLVQMQRQNDLQVQIARTQNGIPTISIVGITVEGDPTGKVKVTFDFGNSGDQDATNLIVGIKADILDSPPRIGQQEITEFRQPLFTTALKGLRHWQKGDRTFGRGESYISGHKGMFFSVSSEVRYRDSFGPMEPAARFCLYAPTSVLNQGNTYSSLSSKWTSCEGTTQ